MTCCKVKGCFAKWENIIEQGKHVFLLAIRLFWGWGFIQAGLGKFNNFDKTVGFFTNLNIPLPALNVTLAAGTEVMCGACLLLGLGSRIMTLPLLFVMAVAYSTAHRIQLLGVFSDPDAFMQEAPFLYSLATLTVLLFGAGKYSLDAVCKKRRSSGGTGCCT